MSLRPRTPFVETEALLHVMEGNDDAAMGDLADSSIAELEVMAAQARNLAKLCDFVRKTKGG